MGVKRSSRVKQKEQRITATRANSGAAWRPRQDDGRRCPMCSRLGALVCTHPEGDKR